MAKVKTTEFLDSLRGRLGNVVFRSWNGKTFVYCMPRAYNKKKQSALQKENRSRFKEMSFKAKIRLRDPEVREHYQQEALRLKLPNAYTALLKELLGRKTEKNKTE